MAGDLSGKVIVLTGGADGIGRECALAYTREGASVAILDRNPDTTLRTAAELGPEVLPLHVDVANGAGIEAAIAAVLARYGRIDAVHNVRSRFSAGRSLDDPFPIGIGLTLLTGLMSGN